MSAIDHVLITLCLFLKMTVDLFKMLFSGAAHSVHKKRRAAKRIFSVGNDPKGKVFGLRANCAFEELCLCLDSQTGEENYGRKSSCSSLFGEMFHFLTEAHTF
jgi:hypothetical protein